MSHQAVSWVLECCPDVRGSDRLVLLSIANHADPDGANAWPSISTLAREAALSVTRTKQAVRALRAAGVIVVDANEGGTRSTRADRRPNLYRIIMGPPGGHTSASRAPAGPDGPASGAQGASAATGGTTGTRVPPAGGPRGADHDGHGGHATGGAGGTRVPPNLPVSERSEFEPPPSGPSLPDPHDASAGRSEEVDPRITAVWPLLAELRLAAREAPTPIRDRHRWLTRVATTDRAALELEALELITWHPTITADDLAHVLADPRSPRLAAHPRRRCPTCDDNGMADTGAGYAPCPTCRPPLGSIFARLDDAG